MKTLLLYTLFSAFISVLYVSPVKAAEYHFDKEHTTILFFVDHLGFSDKVGRFTDYDGTLSFDEDHPEQGSIKVTLHPAGIRTDSEKLDEVLQSKDWFNTKEYPDITFESTSIDKTGDNKADISGWMSMLGQRHYVTFHTTFNKAGTHPVTGQYVSGFSATGDIKRSQFGMNNQVPMVGDEVEVRIEAEFIRNDSSTSPK